jgi:hypothetical protein
LFVVVDAPRIARAALRAATLTRARESLSSDT